MIKPSEKIGSGRNRYNFVAVNILLWPTNYYVMGSKLKWLAFLIHHAWLFVVAVLKLRLLLPIHYFTKTVCQKRWNPILPVSVAHEQRSESVRSSNCEYWQSFLSHVVQPAVTLPLSQVWQLTCWHHILNFFFGRFWSKCLIWTVYFKNITLLIGECKPVLITLV